MLKKLLSAVGALVLSAGFVVTTGVASAEAAAVAGPPDGQCVVDVIHHPGVAEVSHEEYQYDKVIPGTAEVSHQEWRYRTRTVTYGYVEHKFIHSTWDFVSGGTTTISGHGTVSGHWINTGTLAWRAIPDSVINAVWGSGGIPDSLIGGSESSPKGDVPLSAYGAPGSAGSAPYYATKVLNPTGYTDWGPWSGYSTTQPTASDTVQVDDPITVIDTAAVPPYTVYYVDGGSPSTSVGDASWITASTLDGWTQFNERKVVDSAAIDAWDEDVYGTCPSTPCVSQSGTWYTEDSAPTQEADGLHFTGPSAPAVDWYHLVTGNIEGTVGSSYTITSASGYHAALVYEFHRQGLADFSDYATLAIEPYLNGWAPGDTGTFTVTHSTLVWTSKITSGLGSQGQPATIDEMSAIFPSNTLISQGLHLGTNSVDGQYTVVSAVTGCGDVSFVPPVPVAADPGSAGTCNPDGSVADGAVNVDWMPTSVEYTITGGPGNVNIVATGPSTALPPGTYTVTAAPLNGHVLTGTTQWQETIADPSPCKLPTLVNWPTDAVATQPTCTGHDGTLTVGVDFGVSFFDKVDYFLDGVPITSQTMSLAPGSYTVTTAPKFAGDGLTGPGTFSITITPSTVACGDLKTLALTGSSPNGAVESGFGLLAAGLALVAMRLARRRRSLQH